MHFAGRTSDMFACPHEFIAWLTQYVDCKHFIYTTPRAFSNGQNIARRLDPNRVLLSSYRPESIATLVTRDIWDNKPVISYSATASFCASEEMREMLSGKIFIPIIGDVH